MGCVQGRCCGYCRFCCCRHRPSDPGSSGNGRGESAAAEVEPLHDHKNRGSTLSIAAVPSAGFCLQYSSLSLRGYYPDTPDRENQDAFCIRTNLQGNPNLHFFGVFDGHGQFGGECANFVRDKLVELLSADPQLVDDPVKSYNSAFLSVNSLLHASEIDDSMSGTTAITVLVNGDTLFVANVGDSRAVVGVYDGDHLIAEDLSNDQTPFRKDEYQRVSLCGARVLSVDQVEGVKDPDIQSWGNEENDEGDPPRLWMQNAMYPGTAFTRSVGDSTAESIGVIAVPEVLTIKITPDHLFFIVASDGVFEFLSSQAVVDMVGGFKDPGDACSALAAESYKLWLEHESRTDDITVIVIHIKDLCNVHNPISSPLPNLSFSIHIFLLRAVADKYPSSGTEIIHPIPQKFSETPNSPDTAAERSPIPMAPSPAEPCPP
ncbi:putative protein phosphatase 2C 35 [Platanthera zijinensis]|uniref:protein-serine/threonine phosphatase n=1 Tax=Platanthera zijinensis TaxID=2320716 RepID=A0AAP0BE12_9ASPA